MKQFLNSKVCLAIAISFAISNSYAENSSVSNGISGAFTEFMQGGEFEASMQKSQQQNKDVVKSVTTESVSKSQFKLPKFDEFIGKIKYGTHNTASKNGEHVLSLIRSLATDPAKTDSTLSQLQELAKSNNPEALNFVGFVLNNGLFNTPVNKERALVYFKASADQNYQPALYNLSIITAYSSQDNASLKRAINLINHAANLAPDNSFRVCGFASFLYYRVGDLSNSVRFTKSCGSALNGLPLSLNNNDIQMSKRIELLRTSISTGVDDGYGLLERITQQTSKNDNDFLYCKYSLLNRMRLQPQLSPIDYATQCYDKLPQAKDKLKNDPNTRNQVIAGITSFASLEKESLKDLRKSNHFHYSWTVPYLPFTQQDVDLFAPLFKRT